MSPLFVSLLLSVGPAAPMSGTASVPLSELVPLLTSSGQSDARRVDRVLVQKLTLKGHPGESGLWLEGAVTLFSSVRGDLVKVPLVHFGGSAIFEELPTSAQAALVMEGDTLVAACASEGTTTLAFKVLLRTGGEHGRQAVSLRLAPQVAPVPLVVDADESLFEVPGATFVREWGGLVVFPVEGRYEVSWKAKAAPQSTARATRPPVEPSIREAEGRWVSTLEGRATHELQLALVIDRASTLDVTVPAGQTLARARVNGEPREVKVTDGVAHLEVAPAALGDTSATVELSLTRDLGVFHLSGEVTLESPRLSLPVRRWTSSATLPAVFTWRREGGSMEYVGTTDDSAASTGTAQVPGRTLTFRQHLVSVTAPDIALKYSVDISKSYFRGRAAEGQY
jgi:hypothetical protein